MNLIQTAFGGLGFFILQAHYLATRKTNYELTVRLYSYN